MDLFNSLCTDVTEWMLVPFVGSPLAGLVFWGTVVGSLMTIVFGRTSNQTVLVRVVNRTRAQLLAISLFRDDLGVTFRCQIKLLQLICLRLWYSIPPLLVMIIPSFVFLVQLALRYEKLPLLPGDQATVCLHLAEPYWTKYRDTPLITPQGVTVESDGLRDEVSKSIAWRVRTEDGQSGDLSWQLGDQVIKKTLASTTMPGRLSVVSQVRTASTVLNRLLHPAERSLERSGAVRYIEVVYPHTRKTLIAGWDIPWWGIFFATTMGAALATATLFKIKF